MVGWKERGTQPGGLLAACRHPHPACGGGSPGVGTWLREPSENILCPAFPVAGEQHFQKGN